MSQTSSALPPRWAQSLGELLEHRHCGVEREGRGAPGDDEPLRFRPALHHQVGLDLMDPALADPNPVKALVERTAPEDHCALVARLERIDLVGEPGELLGRPSGRARARRERLTGDDEIGAKAIRRGGTHEGDGRAVDPPAWHLRREPVAAIDRHSRSLPAEGGAERATPAAHGVRGALGEPARAVDRAGDAACDGVGHSRRAEAPVGEIARGHADPETDNSADNRPRDGDDASHRGPAAAPAASPVAASAVTVPIAWEAVTSPRW